MPTQIVAARERHLLYIYCCNRHRGLALKGCSWLLAAVVASTLVAGCGNKSANTGTESGAAPLPTAGTLGEQVVLPAQEFLAAAPYKDADRLRGERQAQICKACHSFDADGPNMIGPALFGFF